MLSWSHLTLNQPHSVGLLVPQCQKKPVLLDHSTTDIWNASAIVLQAGRNVITLAEKNQRDPIHIKDLHAME
jgi:hypothetical protein